MNTKKILVLMSGGVDSSTAAALLHSQGHEVAGVYLKLWDNGDNNVLHTTNYILPTQLGDPCWAMEMKDAARVAAKLNIPFTVWDVTQEYKARVLENFYSEYAAGRTPNPDVLCNSEIKFGIALERALAAGYEFVATGHYAMVHNSPQPSLNLREGESANVPPLKVRGGEGELCQLLAAVDKNKDQSYFLWRLTQEQLRHVLFPIGEYTKPEVRALAEKFGLHNATKKDSQGVCFLGKIDLKEFLYKAKLFTTTQSLALEQKNGPIHDVHGNFLGFHDGLAHFTIGQRHGTKLGGTGPYFVVEKDVAGNTLIVANTEDEPKYRAIECRITNYELRITGEYRCMARVRYRAPLVEVRIMNYESRVGNRSLIPNSKFIIQFKEPTRAVAPGQSIVFYDGEKVIGGGVIDKVTVLCKAQKFATVS